MRCAPVASAHHTQPQHAAHAPQGDLLCCESCPAVLHAPCAGLAGVPSGDWHCPACACERCGHANFGALPEQAAQARPSPPSQLLHPVATLRLVLLWWSQTWQGSSSVCVPMVSTVLTLEGYCMQLGNMTPNCSICAGDMAAAAGRGSMERAPA